MKILAISGSLKSTSNNTAILKAMTYMGGQNNIITLYDGIGGLPYFSPEMDGDQSPDVILQYRAQLKHSDGVIICTPEYAHGMPGVLKNALDWLVGSGEFVDKPVAVISASPSFMGGEKAHASLVQTLGAMNANVIERAKLCIPAVRNKISSQGEITDTGLKAELEAVLKALIKAIQEK